MDLSKIIDLIYLLFILFIGDSKIGNEGLKVISEALKINQTLQNLDLSKIIYLIYFLFIIFIVNSKIGNEGVEILQKVIMYNQFVNIKY